MQEILDKLKEDFPNHAFEIKVQPEGKMLYIDNQETSITYSKTANLPEENISSQADEALYEVLKIEVHKFLEK